MHDSILRLVRALPFALVMEAARRLKSVPVATRAEFVGIATDWEARALLGAVWDASQKEPDLNMVGLALTLEVAAQMEQGRCAEPSAELVWSGPLDARNDWRRTEPVLISLVDSARESLWLVTFAAYRVASLHAALERAAERGVTIHFVGETVADSGGRLSHDAPALPRGAKIYVWPGEKRPRAGGKVGLLHAKCALADGQTALISSANLTENALDLNIETGVLLRGEGAARLQNRLQGLVAAGVFELLARSE